MEKLTNIFGRISNRAGLISSLFMTLVMFVVVANIVGRRFFMEPIFGATEFVKYGMMIAASFALVNYEWIEGNIQMTLILEHLKHRTRLVMGIITNTLGAVGFVYVTYYVFLQTTYKMSTHEISSDLSIPVWIMVAILTFGVAAVAVCLFIKVLMLVYELRTGKTVKKEAQS